MSYVDQDSIHTMVEPVRGASRHFDRRAAFLPTGATESYLPTTAPTIGGGTTTTPGMPGRAPASFAMYVFAAAGFFLLVMLTRKKR